MKRKILVIEDEDVLRLSIIELLEFEDYLVFGACNGKEGIEVAIKELPNLILTDIMMPIKNGYEVVQYLKNNVETSSIPVIFLTAKSEKVDSRFGMSLGVEDYITKPFSKQELTNAIKVQFDKQDKIEKNFNNRLEKLKFDLASNLPHELRTPLNGILASSHFLINEYFNLSIDDISELHKTIYTSALRLNNLISNYLLYSDLEMIYINGDICLEMRNSFLETTEFSLKSIFKRKFNSEQRENDLFFNLVDSAIQIDEEHFNKLVTELADNALKFSEPSFKVEVSSYVKDYQYYLHIKNEGIVIDNSQVEKIGAYVQFDRKKHEQQGSGLGLIISKRICQIFDGSIEIKGIDNKFTEVTVKLPVHFN